MTIDHKAAAGFARDAITMRLAERPFSHHEVVRLARAYLDLRSRVGKVAGEMRRKRPSIHCAAAGKEWALVRETMTAWADELDGGK